MALDLGADVLINHHPHVLQGFESYDGKLIAHSLGNFIFDLYYPETMPTMVLTLEIDKTRHHRLPLHARLDRRLDPRAGHRPAGARDRGPPGRLLAADERRRGADCRTATRRAST